MIWREAYSILSIGERTLTIGSTGHPIGSLFKIKSRIGLPDVYCYLTHEGEKATTLTPLGTLKGITKQDEVMYLLDQPGLLFSEETLGEVIDATGNVVSAGVAPPFEAEFLSLDPAPLNPMSRGVVDHIFDTGIKAINGLLTVGVGQRIGLFAGTGVGKSVLMSMIARYSSADIIVIGLIGERGREVKEFVENTLVGDLRQKSIVVAAPADEYPAKRVQAAKAATSIAEYFRQQGKNVLLLMDSLTRYAQAIRELALAEGDFPAARGYPPRVFYDIPRLVERSGKTAQGSITGIYTVLAEGDDMNDPVVDASRGVLDGHIVLSRDLATKGIFPAIDIASSISRLMHQIVEPSHSTHAQQIKTLFEKYNDYRDMELMGALDTKNQEANKVLKSRPIIERFISQDMHQGYDYNESLKKLSELKL